jgi:putative heme-binding domain-containing protein
MSKRWIAAAMWTVPLWAQPDIERGARLYAANCTLCHGAGDAVQNADLRAGRFRHAVSDDGLAAVINAGIPGTAMPPHKFEPAELRALVAYIRSLHAGASEEGDAGRGRSLFEGKGECLKCHRVRGEGSRFGPDLSEIGIFRQSSALQRALLDPTAAMIPINRPVRAVTRTGQVITGRRLNEDTYSVQLITTDNRLVSLTKADLKEYTVMTATAMPSYRGKFDAQELADVLAYLSSLKGVE